MAEYRGIQGVAVQSLASNTGTIEGQIWYDTANNLFKLEASVASASWATGTNYPTAVRDATGFGTPTAAIIMGGNAPPTTSAANTYDGSSWTSTTAVPAAVSGADSDGPQTAGLFVGGTDTTANYDWNGSSWSANPTLPVGRTGHATVGGAAVQTAALAISGEGGTNAAITTSSWNGSTWTAGAAIPSWSQGTSGGGTPSDAFVQGHTATGTGTKNYDGSTWTAGNAANNGHNYGGAGGPATNGITFGGTQTPNPGVRTAQAETYDGTCWTTSASMSVGRSNAHGKATLNGATSSLCSTGNAAPAPFSNATEDFTGAGPITRTITTS
jgi:hypothetical protein